MHMISCDDCDKSDISRDISIPVVSNLFTTAGRKRVAISVAGHTNKSSKGAHYIHPNDYFLPLGAWHVLPYTATQRK